MDARLEYSATIAIRKLERQRDQLREALECWPLKELMGMVEDSGDAQMRERLLWFSEVRDAALKATEEDV